MAKRTSVVPASASRRTLNDVYEAVLDTKTSIIEQSERIEALRQHVNDRSEKLEALLEAHGQRLTVLETEKLDRDHLPVALLKSLGFRLMNTGVIRWALGVFAVFISTTVIYTQEHGPITTLIRAIVRSLTP